MFGFLFDVAIGAVNLVDDISEEVTGIRPVQDTATAAALLICAVCGEKGCDCKSKGKRQ